MKKLLIGLTLLASMSSFAGETQCELKVNMSIFNYAGSSKSIFQTNLVESKIYEVQESKDCYDIALDLADEYVSVADAESGSRFFGLQSYENMPLHVWVEWKNGSYSWGGLKFNGDKGAITKFTKNQSTEYKTGNRRFFDDGSLWPNGE